MHYKKKKIFQLMQIRLGSGRMIAAILLMSPPVLIQEKNGGSKCWKDAEWQAGMQGAAKGTVILLTVQLCLTSNSSCHQMEVGSSHHGKESGKS